MSFNSGAYFGGHSTVSQCARSARAARVALLGVDRAVVEHEDHGPHRAARRRSPAPVDLRQEGDDVRTALGPAGPDEVVSQ